MKKNLEQERVWAVQRFIKGESVRTICIDLQRTAPWLYKWIKRFAAEKPTWCQSRSTQPHTSPERTPEEIESIVRMVRLSLYNKGVFYGDQAIRWELEAMGVLPLPSLRTIGRILCRHDLTHRRTGRYHPKGVPYPALPATVPNQTHQVDLVGPCYLRSKARFYSLNVLDVAINRCGIQPMFTRSGQSIIDAVWAVWHRMGIPDNMQVDNEMGFYGSPAHPRGMGPLIRLCLRYGVKLWFIPVREPWRNGGVEKLNDHYRQKFLDVVTIASVADLPEASLAFEHKHNSMYRYSKLGGQTPLKALEHTKSRLIYPGTNQAPRYPFPKPEWGCYYVVRFIRSDLKLNLFGEQFPAPSESQYEYVVATIDVEKEILTLSHDQVPIAEYSYHLR